MIILIYLSLFLLSGVNSDGILYPHGSETRQVVSLDGMWDFAVAEPNATRTQKWHQINFRQLRNEIDITKMAVPSSYNDIGVDIELRDHVGIVWYQREFFPPKSWQGEKVWIRFSSVCRGAEVSINGEVAVTHDIGHLPFQADISELIKYGEKNIITVSVDNRLTANSIPQGVISTLDSGRLKQTYSMDFFNYAGIDRPVVLYTTPQTYIDDITILTDIDGANGFVNYSVSVQGSDNVTAKVTLFDNTGTEVVSDTVLEGSLFVQDANFWWPYLMDPNPGYLYSLEVQLLDSSGNLVDKYVQRNVGIRTITWDSKSVKVNNKPIYLRGFGRHEDSDIKGKGLDLPLIIRDHELLKWIGANSYRTSHYPYAEEIMDLADEYGIMIIDESPALNTENYNDELLANHKQSLSELIQRDKNRPSVIIWSASNEPRTQYAESEDYYREIISHIKNLDGSRPVTVVNAQLPDDDHSGQFLDIASCNIYYGWYYGVADLDLVVPQVLQVVRRWNELHNIPVLVSEYGADTLAGEHYLPSLMFTEEFQDDLLSKHFEAFDQLREEGILIGEHLWNFADFRTDQQIYRVVGNRKGVFTRSRQPKAGAHFLRKRYWALAQTLDQAELPDNFENYIISEHATKDEL